MENETITLRGTTTLPEISRILDAVSIACARTASAHDCSWIRLALEEVCLNVMKHGYGGDPGPIEITFAANAGSVTLTIVDAAPPFSPDDAPPPPVMTEDWEQVQIGGFGWHLVKSVMDEVHHSVTEGGGNEVVLTKRVGACETA